METAEGGGYCTWTWLNMSLSARYKMETSAPSGRTYMLNSCSTNSRGDDQLFPEDGTGWLSVLLCVQHVLFDPTVYHKVRAVSLENSPLLSVGVSRFLTAKRLEPGWEVMKYLIPQRVCRRSQPLIAVPLLRAGVKEQLEMAWGSSLK